MNGGNDMKYILLVNPKYRLEIRWVADEKDINVMADYFPLGLATVAALTPGEIHVDIWDELVRGPVEKADFQHDYDLVGVTSHSANLGRAQEIGRHFRKQGILTVVGGPGVTSNSDRCRNDFDILFIGEAEIIWPQFLRDWEAGSYRREYRQIEKPDVTASPMPKWDSILSDVNKYAMGTVQTTRGCPNDCEFCDVIYLNGRRQRHKSIKQILDEVSVLQKLGVTSISFNDDNFTVDHRWAKEVLRALIPLNNSFPRPLRYMSQLSIDVSRDEELMELLSDANFYQVLIGIESPNTESLKETGKFGNLKGDLVEQVTKVLSYGIVVRGAMIIGFDNDDKDIFDMQYDFIQKACLPAISMHMLNAPVGTRLWRRLRGEGRVIDAFAIADSSSQRLFNNTIPKLMTRVELMQGFRDLYERLFSWKSFRERMLGFISLVKRPPKVPQEAESLEDLLSIGPGLDLDDEACAAMEEIFRSAHEKAPFILNRVKELVVQFIKYRDSVHEFIPGLDRQIELESTGRVEIKLDNRPVIIPQGFRDSYRPIFRDIHQRVYLNLEDRKRIPEALVEIFVEFLVHEERFSKLEEHHGVLLNEITDRTCARINGQGLEDYVPIESSDVAVPDALRLRLHDDVLKSVEQELMKLVRKKESAAEIVG
jgi:radical SAM superfamily enzyme YgiQ (UPF0313 family)